MYRLMPMKPSILLPSAGRLTEFGDGAVARPFVLLGEAEIEGLVADGDAVLAEEDAEQAVEIARDLREERRHVGGAERNAGRPDHFAALFLDLLRVSVARGLAPGIVGVGDVPLLAHLVDEIGRDGHRLRRRIIVSPEAVTVALVVVSVVSRHTLIMLTTLFSSNTGMQARQMLERKPPT